MASSRLYLVVLITLAAAPWSVPILAQNAKQDSDKPAPAYQAPNYLIESLEGRDLYRAYCAACHGTDARGGGPAATSLKVKPPDLTKIAERHGGVFPLADIEKFISGEEVKAATHGQREMPVWGPILGQVQRDLSFGRVRIRNLALYLESLQTPKPAPAGNAPK